MLGLTYIIRLTYINRLVYTCKDNKIITVGRNEEFISEIIGTTFYDQSILKRQF
jgi:hypothetical protein